MYIYTKSRKTRKASKHLSRKFDSTHEAVKDPPLFLVLANFTSNLVFIFPTPIILQLGLDKATASCGFMWSYASLESLREAVLLISLHLLLSGMGGRHKYNHLRHSLFHLKGHLRPTPVSVYLTSPSTSCIVLLLSCSHIYVFISSFVLSLEWESRIF